jgi:hypothetical protein
MLKFLHHLFDPHCESCEEQKREAKHCVACEVLKMEVARLQIENDRLLDKILYQPPTPAPAEPVNMADLKPLTNRSIPWQTRKRMLEEEDKHKARLIKQNSATGDESVEELERELGVEDAK